MATRKKGELPVALQKKRQVDKIKCTMCGKEKPITEHRYANFYKSYSQLYAGNYDGRLPVCKDCLIELKILNPSGTPKKSQVDKGNFNPDGTIKDYNGLKKDIEEKL